QQLLARYNIMPSMTDGYDCYQNALAERVNGIIKQEFISVKPKDIGQAKIMITQAIRLYNQRRPHLALNYQTPNKIHKQKVLASVTDKDYIYS
ncbi:integrase core domain-containing protein, partial [Sphingobacterium spiritivorum]